jgi:hypothetical protein
VPLRITDAKGLDKDAIGVNLSVAFERFLYFRADLCGLCAWLDRDHV